MSAPDPSIRNRIIRNALLSIVLYSLPVVALFIYLKVTGEKPWNNKDQKAYYGQFERYKKK
ncbi:hypothetical protein MYP_814 [Sporocytophaga myxococcoides]|uniref:Sugar ABC transporter permease n=1 Tax=Sporocytophaga myxococcoides TaxID=153721 RepID=A0A098LAW1_9BACT|nr:hypothetical protein [Sporocytophaga myxococcoides]GAL83587.1 hypothetical protein MYP_814 [Sporocytophaga myxococcoides]